MNRPGRKLLDCFIYYLQMGGSDGPVKIGKADRVQERIKQVASGLPYPTRLLAFHAAYSGPVEGRSTERHIQEGFYFAHLRGEWFSPHRELMEYIAKVATEMGRDVVERVIARGALDAQADPRRGKLPKGTETRAWDRGRREDIWVCK